MSSQRRLALLLWGCAPSPTSMNDHEHLQAIRALSPSQAARLVPQLEKWALVPRGQDRRVARAALEALVRADTEDSFQVTLLHSERDPVLVAEAWAAVPTPRSCHALDRLVRFWPEGAGDRPSGLACGEAP
jgi:hypothetical protein